jgi:hypothetical protein
MSEQSSSMNSGKSCGDLRRHSRPMKRLSMAGNTIVFTPACHARSFTDDARASKPRRAI